MQHRDVMNVLNDPLSRELLQSSIPARMAYTALDGFPRAIPMGFYWNDTQFIMATVPRAAKVRALMANPRIALTIDTNEQPPNILLVRGTTTVEVVDGVPDEYLAASKKVVPADQFDSFESEVRSLYKQMARIAMTPDWAKLIDFKRTLPSAVEELFRERANG
jgi:hypothetical protein